MEDKSTNPITPQEFAKKIKSKYPQYKDIDDVTLTKKMIEKYPEYASQVSLKKKESTQPTSQESVWGSNSQPKDAYTSLVTDQQRPRQESVISDGEQPKMRTLGVDITNEEALKPSAKKPTEKFETAKPYIKKTKLKKELANTKVTAKNQDQVNRKIEEVSKLDQQTKQIEKERFDRIERDFVNSKDEGYAELESDRRLNDLLFNTGVWNKTKTFAKNAYNSIIEGVASNPLNSNLLSFTMDVDPLSDEKKIVRQQAAKDGVTLSEQEVFEQAKKIYKDKQIENIETDRINSFLDDLPEEDRLALKQDRLNTAVHLKEENLKNKNAINAYAAIGKRKIDEYKDVENQLKSLKEKGIAFPQYLYDRYTSLYSDIQNISKNIQKRQDSFLKNKEDLGTVEQEFDLLKRQYGDVENFLLNTSITAREWGVNMISALDFMGSKINPVNQLSSIELQGKLMDINKGLAEERDNLRKPVESIESAEGLLNYASDVLSNQLPNLVVTSTGAGGLALMGAAGVGQKYAEMNQEVLEGKASYSPLQMAAAPLAHGGFEVISEMPTLSILKKGGRVIESIARNEADLLTKTAFQKGKEFARDFAGDQLKEGGGEEFTNLGQNFTNIFILGKKDVGLLDNTGTVLKDTFTLTTMLKVAPHLAGLALKPFQSKVDLGLLDENARKIIAFSRSLNTLNLSNEEKSVLEDQIKKATEENSKIMANTIDNVANMPDSVYLKVNEINKKAAKLKDDARVINDGSLPNKAALLKDLENQYRDLQTERSSLINTKYSPYAQLESLPSEELIDLKNEAQRKLMQELNPDGTKDITITDDQISKEALNIYKERNKPEVTEQIPVETTEVETIVEEPRIKDSQIPLKRETFEYEFDGDIFDVQVTTNKDGSRIFKSKNKDGRVISSSLVGPENTLTTEEYVKNGYGPIQGDPKVEQGNDIMAPAMKEKLTPSQKADLGITESIPSESRQTETTPQTYVEELAKTKESDPETYWSVSEVSEEDAAKGTIIDTPDGSALVKPDGDIAGVFKKLASKAKGVAQDLLNKAVAAGGIKLDNFDGYLTKQYEKAGFRIVSRTPFNEQYAPDGWNKEKHGTPDVVAMVYDPNNELDIEEKTFEDYDEAIAYRDGFVDQAKALTTEANTVQEVIDESEKSNDLPSLVQKAKTALSRILPGTGIILYNTEAEYKAAINEGADENSGGAFVGGKIHINPNRANGRTVAHEVFHAILLNIVKTDPEAKRVTAAMMAAIEKVLPADMKAKLQDFVENGYDAESDLWNEEKLAELVGYLAENFSSLSQPAKNIIKEWLDKLAKLVGLKEFTDKEVIDFMNTISGKIASGEEITEEDVQIIKPTNVDSKGNLPEPTEKSKNNLKAKRAQITDDTKSKVKIGSIVSTRTPDTEGIHSTSDNIVDLKSLEKDELLLIKIAKELSSYGLSKIEEVNNINDARNLIRDFKNSVKDNLRFLHDSFGKEVRDVAKLWYDGANKISNEIADKYDYSTDQVAGVMAVLSPQMDWFRNLSLGKRVIDIYKNQQDSLFDSKMKSWVENSSSGTGKNKKQLFSDSKEIIKRVDGKKLSELDIKDKAIFIRAYDEMYNSKNYENISPNGEINGLVRNKNGSPGACGWGAFPTIEKSISILEDGSIENISKNLGNMHKVRNFFNNISNPNDPNAVTIDTHAVAAGLLLPLSGSSKEVLYNFGWASSKSTGSKGSYAVYADAYRELAKEIKILPRELQSITWEAVRGLFKVDFKANKSNEENVKKVWSKYKDGEISINKAHSDISDLAGGISKPVWYEYVADDNVKLLDENSAAMDQANEDNIPSRKQIIGEKAVKDKLVQNNLDTAKEMEVANKSAEDIFIATGWEKGADNKWKYDLQEGVVEFKNKKNGKASEVINYHELFNAYPKAKNIDIVFMNSDKFDGMYLPSKNRIMLSNSLSDSELKSTLLHEVQHFIQNEEGFAVGGTAQTIKDLYNARIKYEKNFSVKKVLNNIKNSLFKPNPESVKEDLNKLSKLVSKSDEELYKSIAGEVEAFNVEKRAKMTPEERKSSPISKTAEKPKEEQVVISESDTMLKDRKQLAPEFNKELNDKEINLLRRSLRMKFKDSFVVEVLDDYVNSVKEDVPANNEATQYLLDNGVTLNRLANLMVEEGNFETKSRALGYFNTVGGLGESVLSRKQRTIPTVKEIYERSEKAIRDLENTRDYKQFLSDAYKRVFDRQKNIKDLITSFGNKSAKNAYNRLVTKSGASGLASFEFKQAAKKIYGGLKKSDLPILNQMIYAKRIKAINEKRIKEGRPAYTGMDGYSLDAANADLKQFKDELGDKKFDDLSNRASEYFNEYRKSLRELYDSGRISKETYETFKNDEYSPIRTIKHVISPNTSTEEIDNEAKRFGMPKKDIMKLGDENKNEIILDSKWLLATTINATKSRVFENNMLNEFNKAFEGLSKEEKESISDHIVENPVIGKKKDGSLKYKYDKVDLPNGFRKVVFLENGNKKELIMDKKYADQLLDVKNQHKTLKAIGNITGVGILRFFATGGNPLFIFGNIANDFQNILYNTDVYSDFLPLATVQIARDFVKNFVKKSILNDTYNSTYKEYLSHGGALDQMSRDGLQALESRNVTNKIVKGSKKGLLATGNFLSYLGNTSETAFRLAVYDKYKEKLINEFKKENGRTPNSKELDDIMWDAARESRETMPFDQGGDLAKTANIVMPYFNAQLQGFRKFALFATKNPARFGRNVLQYTAMSGALSAGSFAMLLMGIRNDDDDDEKSLKEMIRVWQSVNEYEKANYHIFFTGNKDKNGEYEYYRIKKLPVFSILSTAVEEALLKSFLASKGVDYEFDADPVKQAVIKSSPIPLTVMELFSKNPAVSAITSYIFNTDTFTGKQIFREPKGKKILPEAQVDNKTNQVYKDLGAMTGLSPVKSKVAVEKITTAETTNPAIPLMYSAYDGLFHKKDGFGKEVSDAMSAVLDAFGKKVVRYTNKDIIKYKKQDEIEYKEAVIETKIWQKEQKVYDEIKEVYGSGEKLTPDQFKNIIESNFEPMDRDRYRKKYKAYIRNMGADRELLDILFENIPEVQAMKLNERYGDSFDEEERKEIIEIQKNSERFLDKRAIQIYNDKYKNRKPAN